MNPKVGVTYRLTSDNLVYASAAKGFRPGGPNRFAISTVVCGPDLAEIGLTGGGWRTAFSLGLGLSPTT